MPRYSIHGRTPNEAPAPFNWRRGMFRIWILVSIAWMMGWIIYLLLEGLEGGFKENDYRVVPVLLIGPPVALLLFGLAAGWAFRGFKPDA